MASGTVDAAVSEWLLVFLIVFSLILDYVLHRIEHWITSRHHHLTLVVRVLYRELMVLGVVSFLFIVYETIAKPDGSLVLSFEFAHVFIFLLAIFYTGVVLSTMFTSLSLSKRWKNMEQIELVNYLRIKEQYTILRARHNTRKDALWRFVLWWFPNINTLRRYMTHHEIMAFHDIRFQFIFFRDLPEDFRFSSFLRKIKSATFIDLVESHWTLQIIFLAVVLIDILRRRLSYSRAKGADSTESIIIIVAAVLLGIAAQVLAVKIRRVYWELTRNPRIYYEGVAPAVVEEELDAAASRYIEQRGRRRPPSGERSENDTGNEADDESPENRGVMFGSPGGIANPESEMLEPMRPRPSATFSRSSPPAEQELNGNRANRPVSLDGMTEDRTEKSNVIATERSAPIARRPPALNYADDAVRPGILRSPMDRPVNHRRQVSTGVPSPMDAAAASTSNGNGIAGSSGALPVTAVQQRRNSIGDQPSTASPTELHETAVRHSLDVSRQNPGVINRTNLQSRGASIALAAVEAARKRAAEGSVPPSRQSLDENRGQGVNRLVPSPRVLSPLSSRRVSTDDDAKVSASDYLRSSVDSRNLRPGRRSMEIGKRSIELAVVVPRDELAARFGSDLARLENHDIESGVVLDSQLDTANLEDGVTPSSESTGRKSLVDRLRDQLGPSSAANKTTIGTGLADVARSRSKILNSTIARNLEQQRRAQSAEPRKYPKIVKKLVPRLGRVASPVEKLFWFGSHNFFMWCIELILFFSTVLMAASSAALALLPLSGLPMTGLAITALVFSASNLLFVLFRIAGIIKRYIFILHNASLIPEVVAIEAIHNVRQKRIARNSNYSDASGSETEREEDEASRERRRRLGRFFRSQAESGNIPGIEAGEPSRRASAERKAKRKLRRRILRRARTSTPEEARAESCSPPTGTPTGPSVGTDHDGQI